MKPLVTKIFTNTSEAFKLVERRLPYFDTPFHVHDECEIVYIVKGSGKRIIGDNTDVFKEGELVFLGSKLPHVWFSENNKNSLSHSIVIYIDKTALLSCLSGFETPHKLEQLLLRAKRGLIVRNNIPSCVLNAILSMPHADDVRKTIAMLEIIDFFSKANHVENIASAAYLNESPANENNRINDIIRYCNTNFKKDITLKQVADLCYLTRPSFCRYFKAHTKTTFVDYLTDLRIAHAKKRLLENELETIFRIAIESGFKNLSNFNKLFKIKTGFTPKGYRNQFLNIVALNN